jgi:hypothetical protein
MTAMVEIEGLDVPCCDWVQCSITEHYRSYSFDMIKEPFEKNLARKVED